MINKKNVKEELLLLGVKLAKSKGYTKVTQRLLSEKTGKSVTHVLFHFKTMDNFRHEIIQYALDHFIFEIIAQAIVLNHKLVKNLPNSIKERALSSISSS